MTAARPTPKLSHPRYWLSWLGLGLFWIAAQLPLPLARGLGSALGTLACLFWGPRRRYARRNLRRCFPELDVAARRRLLRKHFRSLGIGVFEFCRAWWGPLGRLPANSRVEGVEHIRDALASGRGVLLLSGHFMTLELCGRLLCEHVPVAGMYRRHDQPVLEWAVERGRARYAAAMFPREELRAAVRHVKSPGILWYAPDQDMRGKDAVFVPFFGIDAATITATHAMARMSGAVVIAFFHRRRADGRGYELRIEPPLADFPSKDAAADSARINALIERMVREAPDEYLWIHRRFKRRPEGEARFYD